MPNYSTLWEARDWLGMPGGMRGSGEGGGRGSGPHRKITRYMGRSRSKPPHTPDEISWFRAWGVLFISLECIRTDCLMEDQARGDSIPARGLGLPENDGFHMA